MKYRVKESVLEQFDESDRTLLTLAANNCFDGGYNELVWRCWRDELPSLVPKGTDISWANLWNFPCKRCKADGAEVSPCWVRQYLIGVEERSQYEFVLNKWILEKVE
jgi:hypothetical protein